MIVVFPLHLGDQDLALKLAQWIVELDGPQGYVKHKVITLADRRVDLGVSQQIQDVLKQTFGQHEHQVFMHDFWNKWAESPNKMIGFIGRQILDSPWMWLEPDVVPMRKGWLDALETEYLRAGRLFMGDKVDVENVPLHMSGVGFYPAEVIEHAGSMLNAHEIAWDVQAAPQIVPQAHWTEQIVHNWKHEAFTSTGELDNLRGRHPEMQLFHADKAHSIIPMLREELNIQATAYARIQREGGDLDADSKPESAPASGETTPTPAAVNNLEGGEKQHAVWGDTPPRPSFSCDIFIKTYPPDYPWLEYCLRSIEKFATGFRSVRVINSAGVEGPPISDDPRLVFFAVGEQPDGYLWQMVIKLDADRYTDAAFILYIDSDTIFTRPVTPNSYFNYPELAASGNTTILPNSKVVWMMTPYEKVSTPWQPTIEKFLKKPVRFEFMRRQPFLVPRWLLAELRAFCEREHGITLDAYILGQPHRAFSEFNALGAFAYEFFRDEFVWVNTEETPPDQWPQLTVMQSWSRGGLTDEIKATYDKILSGSDRPALDSEQEEVKQEGGESPDNAVSEMQLQRDAPPSTKSDVFIPVPGLAESGKCKDARSSRDADEAREEPERVGSHKSSHSRGGETLPIRLNTTQAKWDRVEQLVLELKGYCDNPSATSRVRKALIGGKIFPDIVIQWLKQGKRKRKRASSK